MAESHSTLLGQDDEMGRALPQKNLPGGIQGNVNVSNERSQHQRHHLQDQGERLRQRHDEPSNTAENRRRSAFAYGHKSLSGGKRIANNGDNSLHAISDDIEEPNESADEGDDNLPMLHRQPTFSRSYSAAEEQDVVRQLDRRLVLFLSFLYLLSFLDRSNIGNARIAGLEQSLSMSPKQFDLCLVVFYITYITFEWMILLYRLIPPHIYISCCVLAWGVVASLQSVVTGFRQLLALRALLGITEAAFGPGVPFYMTFFYRRSELAYRVGLQISAAPLAISFASSLAYIIMRLAKFTGLDSWRALFLVEGFPSVITAVVAWYWIPDSPETAPWLSLRERKVARLRLAIESEPVTATRTIRAGLRQHTDDQMVKATRHELMTTTHSMIHKSGALRSKLDFAEIRMTLKDPKAYLTALMFLSVNVSFASLPVFLPTIINSMSFSALTSQILSAPPYLLAFIVVLIVGHYSDKTADSRSIFLCGVASLSCISYATIALAGLLHRREILGDAMSITIRYIAIYPAAMGLFSSVVLIITWTLNNQASSTSKGTGMVILNVVGQCGPLVGVQLFPKTSGPLYIPGMTVCAIFMAGVATLALILRRYLMKLNEENGTVSRGTTDFVPGEGTTYEMVGLRTERFEHEEHEQGEAASVKGDGLVHELEHVTVEIDQGQQKDYNDDNDGDDDDDDDNNNDDEKMTRHNIVQRFRYML